MPDSTNSQEKAERVRGISKRRYGKENHALRRFFFRLAEPEKWPLKWRFLYLTGAMLLLGSLFQVFFLSYTLTQTIEDRAGDNLRLQSDNVMQGLADSEQFLLSQAVALASLPEVSQALAESDRSRLLAFATPYVGALGKELVVDSLDFRFLDVHGALLFEASSVGGALEHKSLKLTARTLAQGAINSGLVYDEGTLLLCAVAPVQQDGELVGAVAVSLDVVELARRIVRPHATMALLLNAVATQEEAAPETDPEWQVLYGHGEDWRKSLEALDQLHSTHTHSQSDEWFYRLDPLYDGGGQPVAAMLLGYDTRSMHEVRQNRIYQMGGLFISGAILLWAILYFNVQRVERFFWRLKKIIISSHSSDFSERFESDHVHCLDVLHCHNEECPVFVDPSRVCYLETGSEAISPVWRDTCIFLNKYETCRECPVYHMRKGDELAEMRNVVNTMMRHWSTFLTRTGKLLAYVLRSQDSTRQVPALHEVSRSLEQMARLTFFSHDLQGTLDKDEVYQNLAYVFKNHFNLNMFVLFEVDHDADRIVIALDESKGEPLCKREVLLSTETCRCKRVSEDVYSYYNAVLCPFFHCDTDKDVRCCLPMVMGGQVGAVFSFVAPRNRWDNLRDEVIPILRKYLDEAAPVLSSLRLLRLTKEQALHDPLTHCHNRRFLDEFIAKYEPLSERENRRTGFIMADLDFYKQVNDDYGHEAGDLVLKQVVDVITESIRRSDLLIRYGGEEFLILLQDVQEGRAESVAEKIRLRIEQHPFDLGGGIHIHKTISLGVAEYPSDGNTLYKAIKFSDVALYEAKNGGRNRVVRFTSEMWQGDEY